MPCHVSGSKWSRHHGGDATVPGGSSGVMFSPVSRMKRQRGATSRLHVPEALSDSTEIK